MLRGELPEPEASTYGIAYSSVYDSLFVTTNISNRVGQTIFIPGGAGGVGHFAVQLAKAYGLRVITSSSKPAGLELLSKLRADVVIDYSKQDVVTEVLTATAGRGVDIVFDATHSPLSLKQSAAIIAKGGEWIRLGSWTHEPPALKEAVETIVSTRGGKAAIGDLPRYSVDPAYKSKIPQLNEGLRLARQLYAEGRVKPYISATVPLEASALQQALQEGLQGTVGKVVVKVQ